MGKSLFIAEKPSVAQEFAKALKYNTVRCDGVMASHADVVSKGDIAYIFYFTHPYFTNEHRLDKSYIANAEDGRACIQAVQLEVKDGRLVCNRNQQFEMRR